MNISDRKSIRKALKTAKPFLSPAFLCSNKRQFICHALEDAVGRGITYREMALAKRMIMNRLGEHYCIESFLEATIGKVSYEARNRDDVQKYRHRWLDALAKEFSK